MLGNLIAVQFNYHGTLSANAVGNLTLPTPATLVGISFGCTSATAATMIVGDAGDPNGIMTAAAIGQSSVPTLFTAANFDGALCDQIAGYHFPAGDLILHFTITHASAVNASVVFYFREG